MKRLIALAGGGLLILALGFATTPVNASSRPSLKSVARAAAATFDETSAINQVLDQITTLGIMQYPTTYVGVVPASDTSLTMYVTGDPTALLAAVQPLLPPGISLAIQKADHSYAQLEALTHTMAADLSTLQADGVNMQSWSPDPVSDTVLVTLVSPADAQTIADAQAVLDARYGAGWVTVASQTLPVATTTDTRDYDSAPFTAGDGIFLTNLGRQCTSGWSTISNSTGLGELLTAGHCGGGDVYDNSNNAFMGTRDHQWIDAGTGDRLDFETIRGSGQAQVWFGDPGTNYYHEVRPAVIPSMSSLMTFDGDVSEEVTDTIVNMVNGCIQVTDSYFGTYTVCDVGGASNNASSQPKICQGGDSGGPAYVRTSSDNGAAAAGTIDAANNNGHQCWFQEVWKELSTANLSLDTR